MAAQRLDANVSLSDESVWDNSVVAERRSGPVSVSRSWIVCWRPAAAQMEQTQSDPPPEPHWSPRQLPSARPPTARVCLCRFTEPQPPGNRTSACPGPLTHLLLWSRRATDDFSFSLYWSLTEHKVTLSIRGVNYWPVGIEVLEKPFDPGEI